MNCTISLPSLPIPAHPCQPYIANTILLPTSHGLGRCLKLAHYVQVDHVIVVSECMDQEVHVGSDCMYVCTGKCVIGM